MGHGFEVDRLPRMESQRLMSFAAPAVLWLALRLGVRDVTRWQEWLLRLFVPPPADSTPATRRTPKPPRQPRLLPAMRRGVIKMAHALVLPEWLAGQWVRLAAAVAGHPAIDYWLVRMAPAKAVPLLKQGLAWVHQLEDEALILATLLSFAMLAFAATTPLSLAGQAVFGAIILAAGFYLGRMHARFAPAVLAVLTMLSVLRFLWWRFDSTLFLEEGTDYVATVVLLAVETHLALRLFARYFRMLGLLRYRRSDFDLTVPAGVVLLVPVLNLLLGVRAYQAPTLVVALYLVPALGLSLLSLVRLDGVRRGWWKWLQKRCLMIAIPFPLGFAALNLACLLSGVMHLLQHPEKLATVLFYAAWACFNIVALRAGGRLHRSLPQGEG